MSNANIPEHKYHGKKQLPVSEKVVEVRVKGKFYPRPYKFFRDRIYRATPLEDFLFRHS